MEKTKIEINCPCEKKCAFELEFGLVDAGGETVVEVECSCCEALLEVTLPGKSSDIGNVYRQIN